MKVALDLQPCCGNRSGIGNYTYELAQHLSGRANIQFVGNVFGSGGGILGELSMPGQIFHGIPFGVYRRIWHVAPISYHYLFPQPVALTVFFDYIVPPGVNGAVMTTVHDLTYLRYPETMKRQNLRRIKRDIAYSLEQSRRVITISAFSKCEIVELLHIPEEKIEIVPPAPCISGKTADIATVLDRYKISRPFLLYVGTIEPRKNLTALLRAFQQLRQEGIGEYQLVLAGGFGWSGKEICRAAEREGLLRDVVITGYLPAAERNTLYRNASAFVFPSRYEGFGIPPLEAMAYGCPVVCSYAASLPETVGDAAKLVDPNDANDIAEGIWRVLKDPLYRSTLINRGFEQIKKYSWSASAEKFTNICETVLSEM